MIHQNNKQPNDIIVKVTEQWKHEFFELPKKIYRHDPVYVPENSKELEQKIFGDYPKNTHEAFVCIHNDEIVARAVTFRPARDKGWITHFECLEQYKEQGVKLLQYCVNHLIQKGARDIKAPKSDNVHVGLLVKGFELPHSIMTPYNPPYYKHIFEKAGLKKHSELLSFYHTRETIKKFKFKVNTEIKIREFNPLDIEGEARVFHEINKKCFTDDEDYVLRDINEEKALIKRMLPFLDKRFILIAEHESKPVGIIIALPDAHQLIRNEPINRIRIILIAVIPEMQGKHVGTTLAQSLVERILMDDRFQYGEASFIKKTNIPSKLIAMKFKAKIGRTYYLYSYPVPK